jgi:hypothetical protein
VCVLRMLPVDSRIDPSYRNKTQTLFLWAMGYHTNGREEGREMTHLGAADQNTTAGREAEFYGNACCLYLLLQVVEQHISHTNHTYRQIF